MAPLHHQVTCNRLGAEAVAPCSAGAQSSRGSPDASTRPQGLCHPLSGVSWLERQGDEGRAPALVPTPQHRLWGLWRARTSRHSAESPRASASPPGRQAGRRIRRLLPPLRSGSQVTSWGCGQGDGGAGGTCLEKSSGGARKTNVRSQVREPLADGFRRF